MNSHDRTQPNIAPEDAAAAQQAIMRHPHFDGNSATAFGFANTALKAVGHASLKARIVKLERALTWIVNSPSAHPANMVKVAEEGLSHD